MPHLGAAAAKDVRVVDDDLTIRSVRQALEYGDAWQVEAQRLRMENERIRIERNEAEKRLGELLDERIRAARSVS